jgi:endonuclease/exonuclease/phosphatase family metal-dependent hydrolase
LGPGTIDPGSQDSPQSQHSANQSPSRIIIGSFNIQVFGIAKTANAFALSRLVNIARRFDILAIQELRANDQSVMEDFVRAVNADGAQFSYIVGPRQGYTASKEQYVYLFDTTKFKLLGQPYVAYTANANMHRPPLVASFQCFQAPTGEGFSFTLLNVHIDPDDVDEEFQALEQIMPAVFRNHPHEDDFIVLGDFNDSANKFQNFRWLENQLPLIRSTWTTKVRSGRSIDNIVIDGLRSAEYSNQSGVLNFMQEFQLTPDEALQISDHYPVWSVFSTVERQARFANNESPVLLNE